MKKIVALEGKGILYGLDENLTEALFCLKFADILQSMPWEGKERFLSALKIPGFQCCIIKLEGAEKKSAYLIKQAGKKGITVFPLPNVPAQNKRERYLMVSKTDWKRLAGLLESKKFKRYAVDAGETGMFDYMVRFLKRKGEKEGRG